MKTNSTKIVLALALTLLSSVCFSITREQLKQYAASLKGLKKADLKTAIYKIIQPASVLDYGSGYGHTWYGFYSTDRIKMNNNEVRNRYSSDKFYFPDSYNYRAVSGMNIEHSFPKSWWGGTENNAYQDLFNLYPSSSADNSSKSNYPMAVVTNETSNGGEGFDKIGTGTVSGQSNTPCWEPGDGWKGDFSRGYMYMATCYQNYTWSGTQGLQELENDTWPTLRAWAYKLYLSWEKSDLVDTIEINRNNNIYAIQGNRNLFVDYPYLAEYVWGDSVDVAFSPETSITTADNDNRYISKTPVVSAVSAPAFSPVGGTYTEAQNVTLSSSTSNVTIYYTLDGTEPTTSSTKYESPVTISATTTMKAIAVSADGTASDVSTATYTIDTSVIVTPEGTQTYSKVTSAKELNSGSTYLIVNESNGKAMSAISGTYRSPADVTITSGKITTDANEEGKPYQVVLGGTSGAYTLYVAADKKYLSLASSSNALNTSAAATTTNAQWAISISGGDAVISNQAYTDRYINYNSGSPRFACYKTTSGQLPVQLYVCTTTSGIKGVVTDNENMPAKVFNLKGQYVGDTTDGLSKGIYVVNGKKVVIK